jgi:hypothetical protein
MVSMELIELRGGYLYQHRPDVIPQGFLTPEESWLWIAYYNHKNAERGSRRG